MVVTEPDIFSSSAVQWASEQVAGRRHSYTAWASMYAVSQRARHVFRQHSLALGARSLCHNKRVLLLSIIVQDCQQLKLRLLHRACCTGLAAQDQHAERCLLTLGVPFLR